MLKFYGNIYRHVQWHLKEHNCKGLTLTYQLMHFYIQ